ncbi:MAG: hypothetical protein PHV18_14725 [Lachnospiraceae bacterium]|nr:hypothetical protein [Lachnospiraceae bacterium]
MKNMNDKTKKWLVVAGGLAVSAVLLVLIAGAFKTPAVEDADIPQSSSEVQDIVVDAPDITEKENDITVPAIDIPEEVKSSNGVDTGTEQTIQPDVEEKPTYTEEELTNPNQKPNGEKVDPPTEENPTPPQTQDNPQEQPSASTGGGLPGFDNVPNAGESENIYVDGMKENGNKIGIMD